MSGLLLTNFMHWLDKSVLFEEVASAPTQNTIINWQRERTVFYAKPFGLIQTLLFAEVNEINRLRNVLPLKVDQLGES